MRRCLFVWSIDLMAYSQQFSLRNFQETSLSFVFNFEHVLQILLFYGNRLRHYGDALVLLSLQFKFVSCVVSVEVDTTPLMKKNQL